MLNTILGLLIAANAPNPTELSRLILQVSTQEQADPILVTRIIIVESGGNPYVINKRTGDYGLMQINLRAHPEVSGQCALSAACNLRAGIRILSTLNRVCEYNVGNMADRKLKNCLKYEQRIGIVTMGER